MGVVHMHIVELIGHMQVVLGPRELLFNAGEPSDSGIFIVVKGQVGGGRWGGAGLQLPCTAMKLVLKLCHLAVCVLCEVCEGGVDKQEGEQ